MREIREPSLRRESGVAVSRTVLLSGPIKAVGMPRLDEGLQIQGGDDGLDFSDRQNRSRCA